MHSYVQFPVLLSRPKAVTGAGREVAVGEGVSCQAGANGKQPGAGGEMVTCKRQAGHSYRATSSLPGLSLAPRKVILLLLRQGAREFLLVLLLRFSPNTAHAEGKGLR